MIEELTAAQIAARIGLSERTIQRYISDKKLPAKRLAHNKYAIDSNDIDDIKLPEHYNEATRLEEAEQKIRILEDRIFQLENRISKIEQHPPTKTTVTTDTKVLRPASVEYKTVALGPDVVSARNFAERHSVSRDRMETMIKRDAFETTPTPYGGRIQQNLTPVQQQAVIAYWNANNIPYMHCENCPHAIANTV